MSNWEEIASEYIPDVEWSEPKYLCLRIDIRDGIIAMAGEIVRLRAELDRLKQGYEGRCIHNVTRPDCYLCYPVVP